MSAPAVTVRFLFLHCNDLAAVRRFYTEAVGLQEASFRDDGEMNWLVYQCDGFQMMFFRAWERMPEPIGWSSQPGYDGPEDAYPGTSWGILVPEPDFAATVERVRESGASCLTETPEWRQDCYWGITVRDPAGNTVELYSEPKARPVTTDGMTLAGNYQPGTRSKRQ